MYDVVVVGARVAGSSLALLLARQGHRVLVVDRATFPSDTVSSHFVQQTALTRLRDWGVLEAAVGDCTPFRNLTMTYTGIVLDGFADPVDGFTETYAPRRTVFDAALVDAAREAGAEVREGVTVTDVVFDDEGRAAGVRLREGDGPVHEVRASVVVGADGAGSLVAEQVGAEMYDVHPAGCFVIYSYFSGLDWSAHHRTGFGREQMGAWPTNHGMHMVATMATRDQMRSYRSDIEGNVDATISRCAPELVEDFRDSAVREERWRQMAYPDNFYRRSHGPGWALVGDAGYHKDPFTGQGMTDAIKYAELLAEHLGAALAGERDVDGALAQYARERDERSHHTFDFTVAISELTLPPNLEPALRATAMSPEYTRKFFGMVAGAVPGEDFFDPENLAWLYETTGMPSAVTAA